jgi:hypothetical protein
MFLSEQLSILASRLKSFHRDIVRTAARSAAALVFHLGSKE